jgi:hypothetical protein
MKHSIVILYFYLNSRQLDVDGDGRVSYRDFDFMMNYAADE